MNPKILKDTIMEQGKKIDEMIAEFASYNIQKQQPVFLKEIVIRLTDAKLWMINAQLLLGEYERAAEQEKINAAKNGKKN